MFVSLFMVFGFVLILGIASDGHCGCTWAAIGQSQWVCPWRSLLHDSQGNKAHQCGNQTSELPLLPVCGIRRVDRGVVYHKIMRLTHNFNLSEPWNPRLCNHRQKQVSSHNQHNSRRFQFHHWEMQTHDHLC